MRRQHGATGCTHHPHCELIYGTFANIRQHKHAHTCFVKYAIILKVHFHASHPGFITDLNTLIATQRAGLLIRMSISFDYITAVRTGLIAQIVSVFYYHFFAPKSFTLGP